MARHRQTQFRTKLLWAASLLCALLAAQAGAQPQYEQDPFNYSKSPVDDPVARLQRSLAERQQQLDYDEAHGYLRALLEHLNVPVSSQVLVFSKTSFQQSRISPRTPRALYFNDDVYVGWVLGGDVIELSAVDPRLGAVFYTLSQERQPALQVARQTDRCLLCHASTRTSGVPGHVVRSVYPDAGGQPHFQLGTYNIDHSSPWDQRWGGWYVTGQHGSQSHLGNAIFSGRNQPSADPAGANLTELEGRFETSAYLSPHSDLVAHLVLDHQAHMHNLIARASYDGRAALWYNESMNKAFGTPLGQRSESTERRLKHAGESLLEYLLFLDEAPLAPCTGTTEFAKEFAARGPRDRRGRSLRDFDLQSRLFKYPCSYLIYSEAFQALPPAVLEPFYRRLWEILTGRETTPPFDRLAAEDRQAILEILRDTQPHLPAYWSAGQ